MSSGERQNAQSQTLEAGRREKPNTKRMLLTALALLVLPPVGGVAWTEGSRTFSDRQSAVYSAVKELSDSAASTYKAMPMPQARR